LGWAIFPTPKTFSISLDLLTTLKLNDIFKNTSDLLTVKETSIMDKIIHLFITKLNRHYYFCYNIFTVKEGLKLKIIFLFFYLSKEDPNFLLSKRVQN
jgi:hypothetical protein